jgi:hypothetical protein
VSICCFQLRRLEIDGANFTDYLMTDLLFNVCLRLEELKMIDMTLDVDLGKGTTTWDQWLSFSKIKKLWLGITDERHWIYRGVTQQHEFIKRCPNLESLTWSFSKGPIPINEIKDLLAPKKSPCLKIKAFALHYPGLHPSLQEDKWVEILKGCNKNLTSFGCMQVRFGELSGQALIKGLAFTLTRLCIDRGPPNISSVLMKIFTSCPHLVHVDCYTAQLDAQDVLGIKRVKLEEGNEDPATKKKATGAKVKTEPLPKSIRPPAWVCKNLQTLKVDICGLQDKAPEWHRAVMKQLATLKRLRVLGVGMYSSANERTRDGLDFRLSTGLDTLSSLTMLETLRFGSVWQEMGEQEIKWMVKTWPRLSYISGWVHHSLDRRVELEKLLKRHCITRRYVFGFDPPVQDESEAESDGGPYVDEDEEDSDDDDDDGRSEYIDQEEVDGLNDDAKDILDDLRKLTPPDDDNDEDSDEDSDEGSYDDDDGDGDDDGY